MLRVEQAGANLRKTEKEARVRKREGGRVGAAVRLAEHSIPVYEVRPGIIATDMTAPVKTKYDDFIADVLSVCWKHGVDAADLCSLGSCNVSLTATPSTPTDDALLRAAHRTTDQRAHF